MFFSVSLYRHIDKVTFRVILLLLYLSSRPVCSLTRRSAPAGETLALFLRGCLVPAQILLLKSKSSCHSLSSIYLDIDCTGFLKDLFS